MVDQRAAGDLDERLRRRVGERPHARAEAGGEHHGECGRGARVIRRPSAGTLRLVPALERRQHRMGSERSR